VGVGEEVAAGNLIAELDASDYNLRVQQAEAALANAEAQARRAEADYERVRGLYENNNASKSDLDGARAANESADAARQSAEKQLELARLQLSYTRLRAPTGGAIASVDIEVNENVQTGRQVVLLTAGSAIEVKVSMPELLISEIVEGSEVEVTFDAIPDVKYPAKVTEVGVASTAMATTFPVTVRLTTSDENIRSGMASQVAFRFESRDQRERFLVPSVAVGEDRQGRFVYVVEPIPDQPGQGIVHRRAAAVGELTAEGLEIFEGLADGEYVVTAGISSLKEGQKVKM
jgi:RND family efflux transporter MFP subunit